MAPPAERRETTTADGARLEYEVLGEGPPLLLLHGLLASRFVFSRQRDAFAAHHRLILPSFRGHDGSDARIPPNYGVCGSDVEDVRAIMDAEGIGRADIFGHSSAGATGFALARHHPGRVRRAVLLEPTLLSLLPPAEMAKIEPDYREIVRIATAEGPMAGLAIALHFLSNGGWAALDPTEQSRRLARMAASAPIIGPHVQGLLDVAVTEADVHALACPTRLYYGADSFPFEAAIADRFRAARPDLAVITLENCGHNIHRDRPDILNAEVLAFLAE